MTSARLSLIFILSTIMITQYSICQWVNTGGPSAFVRSITACPNVHGGTNLFASGAGVFLSTDGGATWSTANNGLTDTDVRAFCTIGQNIFAGTFSGHIFRSSDNGSNWMPVNSGLTTTSITTLVSYGSNLFAGESSPGGVFYSSNQGSTWTQVNIGLAYTNTRRWLQIIKVPSPLIAVESFSQLTLVRAELEE